MDFSTLGFAACFLLFLIQLGIFSKKEDVQRLRAEMYKEFVHKDTLLELKEMMKDLNHKIDKMMEGN